MSVSDLSAPALLPPGLADRLAPDAGREEDAVARLRAHFAAHGYDLAAPPLVEYEETLLSGPGAAMSAQSFRLMDPESRRMMALRADMTIQLARLARTRLADAPRPLRLACAGHVLRLAGTALRPWRQIRQAGVELFGSLSPAADMEVIGLALSALEALGISGVSVDLNLPTSVPVILADAGITPAAAAPVLAALERRNPEAVLATAGQQAGPLLVALMRAAGPADTGLPALQALDLPDALNSHRERLALVISHLQAEYSTAGITIDPVERRGFEYQSGLSFALFARNVRGELGRGGRYRVAGTGDGEPATGFSLFMDSIMQALPAGPAPRRIMLPAGSPRKVAGGLQEDGWVTLCALDAGTDLAEEAAAQGCSHYLDARGNPVAVKEG